MSIRTRILIIIGLALIALAAIVTFNATQARSHLLADKKVKTRHLVEVAHGVLNYWYAKQQSGAIDEATAQQEAIAAIKALRYEKKEYFWINDFTTPTTKMVMHPTVPALDGKVLDAEKFNCATTLQAGISGPIIHTDGKKNLFVAFNEVANQAGVGYVTYNWPKPLEGGGTTKELYSKISFVKKFDGWNWLIGSGIYTDEVNAEASDVLSKRLILDVATTLTVTVLLLLISLWQAKKIVQPMRIVESASQNAVSSDDFTRLVPVSGSDETSRLASAFNGLIGKLRHVVQDVHQSADAINTAAAGISSAAGEIMSQSEQQSSSVNATAAAIEEISSSLSETTSNALASEKASQAAVDRAGQAATLAQDNVAGMEQVSQSIAHSSTEIHRLSESSAQISGIINVIKEIADQTNLLALNAAIEAARAGEQGRGFAVVADEVRKLAERTASSTQQIGGLIDQIQNQIQQAVSSMEEIDQLATRSAESAQKTGTALNHVVLEVERAGERARDIAQAVQEQDASVQKIARQIEEIANMSDESSASARSNSATAEELSRLAIALRNGVAKYRV